MGGQGVFQTSPTTQPIRVESVLKDGVLDVGNLSVDDSICDLTISETRREIK
jgi:hypothetical protein